MSSRRPVEAGRLVRASAPGRVNLIGDHTDYTGGWVLPMAIERRTTVELRRGGDRVELVSDHEQEPAVVPLEVADPAGVSPPWARYVAGVVAVLRPAVGGVGRVESNVPVGAGLSSSAALEVSVALALGFRGSPLALAQACQQAEQLGSGVPSGIMDQLAAAAGRAGHALLIDCTSLELTHVAVPGDAEVLVVDSGQPRALAGSAYARRRAECEAAAEVLGPLREANRADVAALADPVLRRRARHVVTENARVLEFAEALQGGDLAGAGAVMTASHASLRDDFEVSTRVLDSLVERLVATPGVYGARLTGAGFGGSVVALADPDSPAPGWRARAGAGARVDAVDGDTRSGHAVRPPG